MAKSNPSTANVIDPVERTDADGRVLYPWEVSPEAQVVPVQVDEAPEARAAREAQAEYDDQAQAAAQIDVAVSDEQGDTALDFD